MYQLRRARHEQAAALPGAARVWPPPAIPERCPATPPTPGRRGLDAEGYWKEFRRQRRPACIGAARRWRAKPGAARTDRGGEKGLERPVRADDRPGKARRLWLAKQSHRQRAAEPGRCSGLPAAGSCVCWPSACAEPGPLPPRLAAAADGSPSLAAAGGSVALARRLEPGGPEVVAGSGASLERRLRPGDQFRRGAALSPARRSSPPPRGPSAGPDAHGLCPLHVVVRHPLDPSRWRRRGSGPARRRPDQRPGLAGDSVVADPGRACGGTPALPGPTHALPGPGPGCPCRPGQPRPCCPVSPPGWLATGRSTVPWPVSSLPAC